MAEQKKRSLNWRMVKYGMLAQIVPAGFAIFLALYLMPKTSLPSGLGFPLSIAWGAMGAAIHYLSIKRGMRFRLIWTIVFALFTAGTCFGLAKAFAYDFSKLQPCPVCGFVALPVAGATCPVCDVRVDEAEAALEGYKSIPEYIQAAQLMYFQPAPNDTVVNFFGPCNCKENFPKSPEWIPAVTAQDVLEVQAMTKK